MGDSFKREDEKPEEKNFLHSVGTYFREYCSCTSIHGFRYFGEKRTIFERIWWFIVFLICLIACITSIYGVYKKWEGSPVIVNFANQGTPIHKIPFPAITICPESKASQHSFNYTKLMQKKQDKIPLTPLEAKQFEYMSLICKYQPNKLNYTNNFTFSDEFYDIMNQVKPAFVPWECMYLGEHTNCRSLFTPIITDEGVCYTFNMLNRSEIFRENVMQYKKYHWSWYKSNNWSVENGYTEDAGMSVYPRRALFAGAANGLSFNIITLDSHLDYACTKTSLQGYKALLHSPMRMPRPSQEYFRIPLDQIVIGAIQPVMISTSDKVQMYNPKRRGCYFPSERYLKYFKIYSSLNCKMECLTNYTLRRCQCVNFYMPRENGTKICGTGKISCMREAERYMQVDDLYKKLTTSQAKQSTRNCDCLPICTDVTYDIETSQSDWDSHMSALTIFFKSDNFITSERNELYGPIDFLANFGGLLGLFTGFSVLSLMEILYFLSVRIVCNNRLYGYWAGIPTCIQMNLNSSDRFNRAENKDFWSNVRKYLKEYSEVIGVEGVRYLTEKRSRIEKLVEFYQSKRSNRRRQKYKNSPVVVSFATQDTPIYQLPFPTVTVCLESKFDSEYFNHSDIYSKLKRGEEIDKTE
ncbi:ASC domain containing protein [Asbolus verrucosus]|uniref:ASC domain containing protein n=1 Tax=Asbolus verrucosus TaxID=1661398 RepID=A0A482W4J1_ASBVE|nr:ASC domain containing protein [Asbolus verrucosus]